MKIGLSDALKEDYIPLKILHREKQIEEIEKTFSFKYKNNLVLIGGSGSGKTVTIKSLMKKYYGFYSYSYKSGFKTAIKIIRELANINKTSDELFEKFINNLITNPKVLIIDEFNRIKDKREIIRLWDFLNGIYRKTNAPMIIISNNPTIISNMPDDARLTLFLQRVFFEPYNALELYDIILDRLILMDLEKRFPEESLRYICGRTASIDNSARRALFIAENCLLNNDFSSSFIDSVEKRLLKEDWLLWLDSLSKAQKFFITKLYDYYTINQDQILKSSDLYPIFSELSPNRISQLITFFANEGIITAKEKKIGFKGGRTRIIDFSSPEIFNKLGNIL